MLSNRKPTHPGAILREDVFPALHWSHAAAAEVIGISLPDLEEILREQKPITVDLAMRLKDVFGSGIWLHMQHAHDDWINKRGSGRTTRQIIDAPQHAFFLTTSAACDYTRRLARSLRRTDLRIWPVQDSDCLDYLDGYRGDVVIDHDLVLNPRQSARVAMIRSVRPA